MALLFMDSFGWSNSSSDWKLKYELPNTFGSATPGVTSIPRRPGSYYCDLNGTGAVRKIVTQGTTFIVGCAVYEWGTGADRPFLTFFDEDTVHVSIGFEDVSRKLFAYRGTRAAGVKLGVSTNTFLRNTWYYIEVKVVCNNTTGSVTVKVNGNTEINLTNVDTCNNSNQYINRIGIGGENSGGYAAQCNMTDLYILDTTGSAPNNDFLGDVRVDILRPTGNGNSSQFTGSDGNSTDNYLLVDETYQNGDTDYNASSTAAQKDTYAMGDISHNVGSIFGVYSCAVARKDSGGSRSAKIVVRSSGTDYSSSSKPLYDSYTGLLDLREVDPATSAAWIKTAVNAMEVGIEVV